INEIDLAGRGVVAVHTHGGSRSAGAAGRAGIGDVGGVGSVDGGPGISTRGCRAGGATGRRGGSARVHHVGDGQPDSVTLHVAALGLSHVTLAAVDLLAVMDFRVSATAGSVPAAGRIDSHHETTRGVVPGL